MHEFERTFGHWVIRYRWAIIILTLLSVYAAASGMQHLKFTTSYRIFFSPENPQLKAFEGLENTYVKDDNLMIILAPKNGDVFTRKNLAFVEELTKRGWQTPYSTRVDSISNFQYTEAEGDDLIVRDLFENAASMSDKEIDKVRGVALTEPMLANRLIPEKAHVTGVNITVQMPRIDEAKEVPEVVSFVRKLLDEARAEQPDIDFYLTGTVMMNNAFSEASQNDMQKLIPISFGVIMLTLALLLRSFSTAFATLLVVILSILVAMGLGGHMHIPITPPSASAPTIILTLALASSVHVLVSFLHEMRNGAEKNNALAESLRVNLQPVFLTSLTTAIGFLSMNFSEVPPFWHLGNLVAMGVVASFILSITFLPALMTLLPVRIKPRLDNRSTGMERLAEFVILRRRALLWGGGLVILGLVSLIPRNELNDVFPHYFDESIEFRVHNDFADENLGGLYRIDYSLNAGEADGINKPEFLAQVKAFADWWEQQPETIHVWTLTDTLQRLNKNMHGDDPAWYRLPEDRELSAQYLLLYEMSLPYGLDLNNQINVNKSATRLSATIKLISTNEVLALEQRAEDWLHNNALDIADSKGSSPTIMFSHIGHRNIKSMLLGTSLALVMISMILVVALRSVKIGLISMVPNLAPAAMGFGVWGLITGEIGLGLSIVIGMTLGIVVDDTVHFLSKYLRARREKSFNSQDAVRYAFSHVGTALWITSAVLILGFLILALSAFQMNSQMGLLTAIVIALALAADFLFLPPLLIKFEGDEEK